MTESTREAPPPSPPPLPASAPTPEKLSELVEHYVRIDTKEKQNRPALLRARDEYRAALREYAAIKTDQVATNAQYYKVMLTKQRYTLAQSAETMFLKQKNMEPMQLEEDSM